MGRYEELTKDIPWWSTGPQTVATQLGRSLVPVGILAFTPQPASAAGYPVITQDHPDAEKYLMNIVGTAIQGGDGKLATCGHVIEAVLQRKAQGYILARIHCENAVMYVPYPIQFSLRYVDPRTNAVNTEVDVAALLVAAKSTPDLPYETPIVNWEDSTKVGVGDPVVIGGYPYGKDMFLFTKSNRGLIQPTFYSGIVSAVLPVLRAGETRLLQISIPSAGGMSGGAVFNPETGGVLGTITSCVHLNGIPQPMSYAIPSEVIAPYLEVIIFRREE